LVKKYPLTVSSIGYQIYTFSILDFSLAKDEERGWLSRLRTRYGKAVGDHRDIESDFYSNDSPNVDLENQF